MKVQKKWVAIVAVAALVTGCNNENSIAKVGDREVTKAAFKAHLQLKRIPEQDATRTEQVKQSYLQRLALVQAIEKTSELDSALIAAEVEDNKTQMQISRYFDKHLKNVVTDEAVRNYYASNAEQYQHESVSASHILVRVNTRMTENERAAKLTIANEAYSLLQSGKTFSEIAESHSEDTLSGKKGGDLGWLREGAVGPEFSKQLFTLKAGEYTKPFLTPLGFHIVKLVEGPQTIKRPLESVSGDIRYQLRGEAKQAETKRLLESIKITEHN